ncbi:hypothetical protein NCER_102009 [Vairimorpha ceranae BRL01]|uniref:Uncharacterized protein n=2 Tax=Vairimorpha ceranae TaxID=40302 RepID=C4VB76_VAIC1|nr:hypothetical protein AAJ76_1700027679 [Vairimorpha ceranae]EEQ81525.1 hypothetical protein NCER_102009 [Vairimorpha ceranae BRL01]KAF5140884.1 hypothetical protein G9O61_00g008740 [Vairimorpha ceranae]KKO75579.1 hypothetical protein AAJ76_1700027679 [Vairimorpha ceranae]
MVIQVVLYLLYTFVSSREVKFKIHDDIKSFAVAECSENGRMIRNVPFEHIKLAKRDFKLRIGYEFIKKVETVIYADINDKNINEDKLYRLLIYKGNKNIEASAPLPLTEIFSENSDIGMFEPVDINEIPSESADTLIIGNVMNNDKIFALD